MPKRDLFLLNCGLFTNIETIVLSHSLTDFFIIDIWPLWIAPIVGTNPNLFSLFTILISLFFSEIIFICKFRILYVKESNDKTGYYSLAGLGTRLLPLTSVIPKELLPINGKPGLEYIMDECINSGIKEVIFIISTKKQSIKKYFYNDKFY